LSLSINYPGEVKPKIQEILKKKKKPHSNRRILDQRSMGRTENTLHEVYTGVYVYLLIIRQRVWRKI